MKDGTGVGSIAGIATEVGQSHQPKGRRLRRLTDVPSSQPTPAQAS